MECRPKRDGLFGTVRQSVIFNNPSLSCGEKIVNNIGKKQGQCREGIIRIGIKYMAEFD